VYKDKTTVYVVDDDAGVREFTRRILGSSGYEVRDFESAQALLDCPTLCLAACLILDVKLPDLDGLELQQRLATERSAPPVVFITGYGDIPMTVKAMRQGAVDFLPKPFGKDELLDAVRKAVERHQQRVRTLEESEDILLRVEELTPREVQVFERVASGMLNREIASELGTSEQTVKLQRASVMRKLGVESLADLVRLYEQYREARRILGR
jgi:FixJ family two-component response regulator